MANPETIAGELAVLVAGTAAASVALDARREYTFAHDGEDANGDSDVNTIYLATAAEATATAAEGLDKFKLLAGRSVVIGPGVGTCHFKVAAGAPTMSVAPSPLIHPSLR